MAVAKLVVEINADLRNMQRDLDRATGAIRRFTSDVQRAGTAMTVGLTVPLSALGVSVGKAAADMDSLRRGLTSIAGSSKAASEQLTRLEDIARLPGLGFKEAIQGSIRLQAVGLSVGVAERSLRAFGNAVALTGGGKAELDRITVQLGQLSAKGKVLGQDLRPIIEAAPAVGRALREAFGTVDASDIEDLGLTTEQFLNRLLTSLEKLPRVTGGVKNSFENLTDSLFRAKVAIGEQLVPVIVPLVDGLTRTLEKVRTLDPELVRWGIAIAAVAAVIGPLILTLGAMTSAVAALAAAIGIGLLPLIVVGGPIVLGLGALAALWVRNKLETLAAANALDTFKASLLGLDQALLSAGIQQRITALVNIESARTKLTSDLVRATAQLDTLQRQAPGRFGDIGGAGNPHRDALGRLRPGQLATPKDFDPAALTRQQAEVTRLTSLLTGLGGEYNRVREEFRAMSAQFNQGLAPAGDAAPLSPHGDAKGPNLSGLLDGLTDRLRELRTLQAFGVAAADLLPDNIQEQIRLSNSLAGQLDTLTDGLRRFQQAGRTPPQGLTWGIDALTAQLAGAERELDRLALKFSQLDKMRGTADVTLGGVGVGLLPTRDQKRLGGSGSILAEQNAGALASAFAGLRESMTQFGRSVKEFGTSQLRNAVSGLAGMAAQFTPAGLAAYALSSAMEALRPVLEAVLVPVKIFGEILAISVVPWLRLLFPILKALAIVLSYVQEAFDRVVGVLLKGIGWFVRAIGKIINFLDPFGNPGNGLVKLGNSLRDSAESFFDAADEIKKKRKELMGMSFDDALNRTSDNLNRLSEAVLNAVEGFKVVRYRFAATQGAVPAAAPQQSVNMQSGAWGGLTVQGGIHIQAAPGEDANDFWQRLKRVIIQEARSHPEMRQLAAAVGG